MDAKNTKIKPHSMRMLRVLCDLYLFVNKQAYNCI